MYYIDLLESYAYPLLIPVFSIFKIPGIPIFLAMVFFIVLVLAIVGLILKTLLPLRQIKAAIHDLKNLSQPADLKASFQSIDQKMRERSALEHAWREFHETLILPETGDHEPIKNTARPSNYINREAAGLNFPILHALPNYFVGFGLLFTFFGLVAALYYANQGVTGNIDEAQSALSGLLSAATFKFLTSIAGLICSIIFSISYKVRMHRIDKAFGQLCDQLERLLSFVTPEEIAAGQLKQLEEQTVQLRRFNSDIAMEIVDGMASKLDASIADGLRRAIEPLSAAIDRLSGGMGQDNQAALREMVELFQHRLKAGAGREFAALAEALQQMQGVLTGVTERFGNQSELFGTRVVEAADRLDQAAERAAAGLAQGAEVATQRLDAEITSQTSRIGRELERAGGAFAGRLEGIVPKIEETLGPLGGRLASFTETLQGLDGRLRAQTEAFADVTDHTRASIEALDQAATRLRDAATPVAGSARALGDAAAAGRDAVVALREIQTRTADVTERMATMTSKLEASWAAYERRFDQVDQSLEGVFEQFAEATRAHHESVETFVRELAEALDHAVGVLAGSIGQLDETLDQFNDAAARRPLTPAPRVDA